MFNKFIIFVFSFVTQAALAQVAGDPVRFDKIGAYTIEQITLYKKTLNIPTPTISAVTLYKLSYYTPGVDGKLTIATAGVAVPDDQPLDARPVVSYQHGTTSERKAVPSSGQTELALNGAFYSSNGYVVVAADYLGLGDEPSFHPYLHADTQASACADALLAVYKLKLTASNKLFLAGYSQGGHATMALHRYWQNKYGKTHPVTAAAPMAGPYDLSGTVIETSKQIGNIAPSTVTYTGYLLFAMNMIYNMDPGLNTYVQAPYAEKLPTLYDGYHDFKAIMLTLPNTLPEFLTTSLINDISSNADNNAFILALRKNDVYDWKSEAPIQFCHGDADLDVPPYNTIKAMAHMASLGGGVSRAVIPSGLTHATAGMPCFRETAKFFETFR